MSEDGCNVLSILIPDGATNADVIKALFPDVKFVETNSGPVYFNRSKGFDSDWWNSPCKKEVKE